MHKRLICTKTLVVFFGVVLFTFSSRAQSYEEVYAESNSDVQFLMDQNKMLGKPILSDVYVSYEFSFSGLDNESKVERLRNILMSELDAANFVHNASNGHVSFTCLVQADLDKLKGPLSELGIGINNIYKKEYFTLK